MNDTLELIIKKFSLNTADKNPIVIRNINRTIMAQTLADLNFKVGAEVGVAQGDHAATLCEQNPGVKLYCIDVWERYPGYREYTDRIDRYFFEAEKKLKPFNTQPVRMFSMNAVKLFEDGELDFVYIDAAHDFKNVAMDIYEWSKKVRVGGIVFGHDYKRWKPGRSKYIVNVKDVVQAYTYSHNISPWFELANDIKDPKFGPDVPGWMFVRQKTDYIF